MNLARPGSIVLSVERFSTVVSKWDYKRAHSAAKTVDGEEKSSEDFSESAEECEHSENTDDD
ncbi:MAG: hypothetical protein IPM64_10490 [Phycisphaerales bacterium]|nr:hypothetical protein [Phycisphaerales bacterium]